MDEDETLDDGSGSSDCGNHELFGGTLSGAGLAQTVVDTHTANELGLVRSEVHRLRAKVELLEHEKEVMVDDFNITTQMLLDRIRTLETEKSGSDTRPQTAAILARVEERNDSTWRTHGRKTHEPEILLIEEEDPADVDCPSNEAADTASGELKECGNCRQMIPLSSFTSHSVFCYRNNYYCDVFKKLMPVSDKESHIAFWTDAERLIDAAKERDLDTLQKMCSIGADFQTAIHPKSGDTVLHVAASNNDMALVELCMGYGVDVDPMNSDGETPLHLAASKSDMQVVRLLVELGAELNISNGIGESPLMLVCRRGNAETARYLVEKKADVEAKTRLGDTPLQIAQRLGFQETVLALSMAGATLRPGTPQRRSSSRGRSGSPAVAADTLQQPPLPAPQPRAPRSGGGGYPPCAPAGPRRP